MRELKLKYFIELASNLGAKSRSEAQLLEDAQRRMNQAIGRTADQMMVLDRTISRVGHNSSTERQIGYLQRLGQAADAAGAKVLKMKQALAKGVDNIPERAGEIAGAYYGAKTMVAPPLRAFSSLEAATQDLRIAMTDAKGQVSKDFDKISAEATKLGNQLPGTTKDFMMAARALIEQGTPTSVVAGGGLRASSYFGALLGVDQYQSAETIAKMREAYGLKDDELVKMADLMQRGRFAFGINPMDYKSVASYAAPTYNTMGLSGLDNAKKLLAVQGIAASVGLESSSFGTNFSMMLQRLGQVDSRVNRNSKEAKEVKSMLGEHGIDMSFYDAKGQFAGIENMLGELAKLRPLSQVDQQKVITRLFGVEAGRPASILVQKGLEEYKSALAKIDNQASLDQRITLKMETFASKLESLGGTIENVMARIGTQTGQALKPVMDGANSVLGGPVANFFDANPGAGTAGLMAGGYAGALVAGRVGGAMGSLAKSLILRGAPAGTIAGGAAPALAHGGAAGAGAAATGLSAAATGLSAAAQAGKVLKYGGITAGIGATLEGAAILADPKAEKGRDLTRLGLTTGAGLLGGALSGAAIGSVLPGIGTAIGAIVGMLGTSLGSGLIFDQLWKKTGGAPAPGVQGMPSMPAYGTLPTDNLLMLTAPGIAGTSPLALGRSTELKVGEGRLTIDIRTADGISATPLITQQPSIIRISPGNTNPAGYR